MDVQADTPNTSSEPDAMESDGAGIVDQIPGGRYHIVERLSTGAIGAVYKALDTILDRPVAVKCVRLDTPFADQTPDELRERFVREARIAARLQHPNIVTIHDIIATPDRGYIIMEFIEGRTLESLIDSEKRLPLETATKILSQLASALDYAHGRNVVHRDVKPSNILVSPSLYVWVTDFGIAKSELSTNLTMAGGVLGTPDYMSPEQAKGEDVDSRSDLFSLGCIFFECVVGEKPFRSPSLTGVLLSIINDEPVFPLNWRSLGLPMELKPVLHHALEKERAKRFASGSELVEALESLSDAATPPDAGESSPFETRAEAPTAPLAARDDQKSDSTPEAPSVPEDQESGGSPIPAAEASPEPQETEAAPPESAFSDAEEEPEAVQEPTVDREQDAELRQSEGEPQTATAAKGVRDRERRTDPEPASDAATEPGSKSAAASESEPAPDSETPEPEAEATEEREVATAETDPDEAPAPEAAEPAEPEPSEESAPAASETPAAGADAKAKPPESKAAARAANEKPETPQTEEPSAESKDAVPREESNQESKPEGSKPEESKKEESKEISPEQIRAIKEETQVLHLSPTLSADLQGVEITPEEGFLLSRIDGASRPNDIMSVSPMAEGETVRALLDLLEKKLIRLGGVTTETSAVSAPKPETKRASKPQKKGAPQSDAETAREVDRLLGLAKDKAYPALLGIPSDAPEPKRKAAYLKIVAKYHPDRFSNSDQALRDKLSSLCAAASEAVTDFEEALKVVEEPRPKPPPAPSPTNGHSASPPPAAASSPSDVFDKRRYARELYDRALTAFDRADYWDAIQLGRQAIEADGQQAEFYCLLGRALLQNKKWRKEAADNFLKASELEPGNVEYIGLLGAIYQTEGLTARANAMLKRARAIDPEFEFPAIDGEAEVVTD